MAAQVRITFGRRRQGKGDDLQSLAFDARDWQRRDAQAWLERQGFDPRGLQASQGKYKYEVRARKEFLSGTLRTVRVGRWEHVTMASNPKSKKKRRSVARSKSARRAKKNRRASPKKQTAPAKRRATKSRATKSRSSTKRRAKRRPPRTGKGRTTRTKLTSLKIVQTNPKRRYTVAFTAPAAQAFGRVARLPKPRLREMRRSLRRHPSGGVYVALPEWHGSRDQATALANRVRVVLAYAAGRKRSTLSGASAPRVVTVP